MRKICVIDWQSYPSLCDTLFSVYSMIRHYGFYQKRMIRHYVIHPTKCIMALWCADNVHFTPYIREIRTFFNIHRADLDIIIDSWAGVKSKLQLFLSKISKMSDFVEYKKKKKKNHWLRISNNNTIHMQKSVHDVKITIYFFQTTMYVWCVNIS